MSLEEKIKYVVLVNEQGHPIGVQEKLKAHQEGQLHKAFSIFIFNPAGEILLQQRAMEKYHFGGIWSNTCCSHPGPEEDLQKAAHLRLREEMGFDTPLQEAFSFIYKCNDAKSGLTEHEWDTVFIGEYDGDVVANTHEVMAYRWISLNTLEQELTSQPEKFSEWFKQGLALLRQENLLPASKNQ